MALYLEFDLIVRRFARAKLRYAVAGGLAVGLHGYVRATQDMDFLVHEKDLAKAKGILLKLGYRANPAVQEFARAGLTLNRLFRRLPREEDLMLVDILIPTSARMLGVLERAVLVPYGRASIRVVTAKRLKRMSPEEKQLEIDKLRTQLVSTRQRMSEVWSEAHTGYSERQGNAIVESNLAKNYDTLMTEWKTLDVAGTKFEEQMAALGDESSNAIVTDRKKRSDRGTLQMSSLTN